MNSRRDEEVAASVGAHRDLGPEYDDAIAAGLVERIGAEIDRRVDERLSHHQPAQHPPAALPGRQISWQQVSLALGSLVVGTIASASINNDHGNGTWPIIVIWVALTVINMAIFRAGRSFRRDRSSLGGRN